MRRSRRIEILFSDSEHRKLREGKGDKAVSDYVRSLIERDLQEDRRESAEFKRLIDKLRLIDFEKLSEKIQQLESVLRYFQKGEQAGRNGGAGQSESSDKLQSDLNKMASILAVNVKAAPGESRIFAQHINDDLTVREPMDFIFSYLRFLTEQRPYAASQVKKIFPDFLREINSMEGR